MVRIKLIQCLLHDAHATPRQQRVTLVELANLIQSRLRRRLLIRTESIRVRRLGILDLQWIIAMESPMATATLGFKSCLLSSGNAVRAAENKPGL